MFKNISIIGDGAMGTICGLILCSKNLNVKIWGHDPAQLKEIADAGENIHFLPGYPLPKELKFTPDDTNIAAGAELLISAVPCQFIRPVWQRLKPHIPADIPIISVAKGVENETLLRPTEVLAEVLGRDKGLAVFSGPTIADELAQKLPATATVASTDSALAKQLQETLTVSWLRVYTNDDILGVELAGAMKNVIAIAAGCIDGIKAGDNAKAALLARGLAEIQRLGMAMGANEKTFAGLSGLGDLVTTCISPMGRNRSFGERIGKGRSVDQAINATKSVVEGVATCKSVVGLAQKYNVEMPITQAIYSVLFEDVSVKDAITALMTRKLKAE